MPIFLEDNFVIPEWKISSGLAPSPSSVLIYKNRPRGLDNMAHRLSCQWSVAQEGQSHRGWETMIKSYNAYPCQFQSSELFHVEWQDLVKEAIITGAQCLLCGRYGCTIVMLWGKQAASQRLSIFLDLCIFFTWHLNLWVSHVLHAYP